MAMTGETIAASTARAINGGGVWVKLGKELLKMVILVAAGYIGATFAFSNRLKSLEEASREFQYIQCNGLLPSRARAAVTMCRGIPVDPALRALLRDTL